MDDGGGVEGGAEVVPDFLPADYFTAHGMGNGLDAGDEVGVGVV